MGTRPLRAVFGRPGVSGLLSSGSRRVADVAIRTVGQGRPATGDLTA